MEKPCDFLLGSSDPEIAARLAAPVPGVPPLDRRFTQDEEMFLVLDEPFTVPSFEIHHPVEALSPSEAYLGALRSLVSQWVKVVPGVFHGLSWYFNPRDLFRPVFVQLFSSQGRKFLYLLRPDLNYRGRHSRLIEQGSNDHTPVYSTRVLFLEAEVLPLESWQAGPDGKRLYLAKLFEHTWTGESGRGYVRTGRWIDREITKMVCRAALPPGAKTYPYYPLRCHYSTLVVGCVDLSDLGRRRGAADLAAAWPLVAPYAPVLQTDLKDDPYREDHPLVATLRAAWNSVLADRWTNYALEPYLGDQDGKEYRYHAV